MWVWTCINGARNSPCLCQTGRSRNSDWRTTRDNWGGSSFREMREYIASRYRRGYEADEYAVDLYSKVSFPVVSSWRCSQFLVRSRGGPDPGQPSASGFRLGCL